jgi:hypothetical protein
VFKSRAFNLAVAAVVLLGLPVTKPFEPESPFVPEVLETVWTEKETPPPPRKRKLVLA